MLAPFLPGAVAEQDAWRTLAGGRDVLALLRALGVSAVETPDESALARHLRLCERRAWSSRCYSEGIRANPHSWRWADWPHWSARSVRSSAIVASIVETWREKDSHRAKGRGPLEKVKLLARSAQWQAIPCRHSRIPTRAAFRRGVHPRRSRVEERSVRTRRRGAARPRPGTARSAARALSRCP